MPSPFVTKSDFKACFDCRTRLFFRKEGYPSGLDDDEYMRFLADGGFMIETVAKVRYPKGVDLVGERDPARAFARTAELLAASTDAVVFEAAALSGKYYARIDVLRREGNVLHLVEVKSSSINTEEEDDASSPFLNAKGTAVASKWRDYLIDVAFQAHVLGKAFPDFTAKPWLCVVDKAHAVGPNETLSHFRISRQGDNPKARPEVVYSGDLKALQETSLLALRQVSLEVGMLMDEVIERAETLAELIGPGGKVRRVKEDISEQYKACRSCEFRFKGADAPERHGFAECWGGLARVPRHILDLFHVSQIGTTKFPDPVPPLLAGGHASFLDLREDQLGREGSLTRRRDIQWRHSQGNGSEYLPLALKQELASHQQNPGWPLRFVDFEACDVALPHHAGLRPYERVAFQWSCHSIDQQGGYTHKEWLNTGPDFPGFRFLKSLREQLGEEGTVYVWSHYEQTTLRKILGQIDGWLAADPKETLRVAGMDTEGELLALAAWVDRLLGPEDEKGKRHASPRIKDLHQLALQHYFHPDMGGRTSIKVVLPAVWQHAPSLQGDPWFAEYVRRDDQGRLLDPYETLPALPLGDEDDEGDAVVEGTGAIRVYQDLIFRQEADPQFRKNREQLLRQYCRLDTAAMVMIWKHWTA